MRKGIANLIAKILLKRAKMKIGYNQMSQHMKDCG